MSDEMLRGFDEQRSRGINVDWFTWQIAWHDARAVAIEESAVTAWGVGMDEYGPHSAFMDPRHVGSKCAQAIRALQEKA